MKKLLWMSLIAIFPLSQLVAQESTFEKGSSVLNLGIGLGNNYYSGSFYSTQVPPISASYEVGIADNILEKGVIGIGGYFGYSSYKWHYLGWGWRYSNLVIGARGTFHYPLVNKLDTYGGLLLGYNIVTAKEFGNSVPGYSYSASASRIAYSLFIGGRYYFTDKFAVMAELGYGITYLNLGVALKFK